MKNITILVSLFLGLSQFSFSQTNTNKLRLFAKYSEQGIRLKVAPQTGTTWLYGAENGYDFYRREVGESSFVKLNEQPILPWSDTKIVNLLGVQGDSLIDFQEASVFEQIRRRKETRSAFETVQYEQELNKNYGFYFMLTTRIPEISVISGLEYTDGEIENGKAYEYKVESAGSKTGNFATCNIYSDAFSQLFPTLDAYEGEMLIDIAWLHPDSSNIVSYFIERSQDGNDYTRLTDAPLFLDLGDNNGEEGSHDNRIIRFKDSILQNYVPYQYRLVGIDVWGEETMPSAAFIFMGRDRTAPELPDSMWVQSITDSQSLKFQWKYGAQPSDLAGIMVFHADSIDGIITELTDSLMPANVREASLREVVAGNNHYFQLLVQDTAGNYTTSKMIYGYLPDIYPPLAPQNLEAKIDSLGIVSLAWNENNEADLQGYAVYRSNGKSLRMIKISDYPVEENTFIDTLSLNRLNKETYYAVMALDLSFNYSEYSGSVEVLIPDIVAPAAPGLMNSEINGNVMSLSWIPSVSDDVISQFVYAVNENDQVIDTLDILGATATSYSGNWTTSGWNYFAVQVVDQAGNTSALSPKAGLFVKEKSSESVVSNLKVRKRKDAVDLSWKISNDSNFQSRVYRKVVNGSSIFLDQCSDKEYKDLEKLKEGTYFYYVVLVNDQGVSISGSEMVKIKL